MALHLIPLALHFGMQLLHDYLNANVTEVVFPNGDVSTTAYQDPINGRLYLDEQARVTDPHSGVSPHDTEMYGDGYLGNLNDYDYSS